MRCILAISYFCVYHHCSQDNRSNAALHDFWEGIAIPHRFVRPENTGRFEIQHRREHKKVEGTF